MRFVFCPLGGAKLLGNFAPTLGVDKKNLALFVWLKFGAVVAGDVLSLTYHLYPFRTGRFREKKFSVSATLATFKT